MGRTSERELWWFTVGARALRGGGGSDGLYADVQEDSAPAAPLAARDEVVRNLPDDHPRVEALRALAQYPEPGLAAHGIEADGGMGHVYLIQHQFEKAVPYLRRAADGCLAIEHPFESTWAQLHLGMALEASGDRAGACQAYGVVLQRWEKEARSVSAQKARSRRAALGCAPSKH